MKVLFAVNDENISTSIVKKYQKQFKEIISYKNVYYFNAIIKELQRNKNYDRVVISEDLEEFTSSSIEQKDKFIFDRLDNISDEAVTTQGIDIPIILICSERRAKGDDILVKFFGISIYNAIIGEDRTTDEVCRLINKPRSKKEAKIYYKIDSDNVGYEREKEDDVSEVEMQNILAHFRKLGKNEERYVESFNNIVSQYNDNQLKVIIAMLPNHVKEVLQTESSEYQRIMGSKRNVVNPISERKNKISNKKIKESQGISEKTLEKENITKMSKPIVVPSTMDKTMYKKISEKKKIDIEDFDDEEDDDDDLYNVENIIEEKPKRRGRPRKNPVSSEEIQNQPVQEEKPKRRGRPKKIKNDDITPKEEVDQMTMLPGFDDNEDEEENILPGFDDNEDEEENILPGFDDNEDEEESILPGFDDNEDEEENILPGFDYNEEDDENILPRFRDNTEKDYINNSEMKLPQYDAESNYDEDDLIGNNQFNEEDNNDNDEDDDDYEPFISKNNSLNNNETTDMEEYDNNFEEGEFESLLSENNKIVTFVGTSKNGTSFIVNNIAQFLSNKGINTAILDATQNKSAYYIYTNDDDKLRNIAINSFNNLVQGNANGVKVNNYLTVYTGIPSKYNEINNSRPILETLVKNYSVVLIDCDFQTPVEYFSKSQEIYLVQSMDVLTIQPLTEFLRKLKVKNVLDERKIRIVLNKILRVRGLGGKNIVGGMSNYNDPEMAFMTELFDRNTVKVAAQIPFDEDVYAKYLENIVECSINTNGYPKEFKQKLNDLSEIIYPLLPNNKNKKKYNNINSNNNSFSPGMNSTLNNMRKKY